MMPCISDALMLMLSVGAALSAPAPATPQDNSTYETKKTLAQLERCLTKSLSKRGDVTTFNSEGMITVMLKMDDQQPLLIDLAPPKVTVTTRAPHGTRELIRACV